DRQRLLEVDLLVAQRVEYQIRRHQFGQRSRLDRRVDVAPRQHLAGGDIEQEIAARRDFGRLRHLRGGGKTEEGKKGRGQRQHEFFHGLRRIRNEGGGPPGFSGAAIVRERNDRLRGPP